MNSKSNSNKRLNRGTWIILRLGEFAICATFAPRGYTCVKRAATDWLLRGQSG